MTTIKLYNKHVHTADDKITMDCYLCPKQPGLDQEPSPAVIIFPGGGYSFTSDREAAPIANTFVAAGYSAFVVWYTVAPNCEGINPLLDAAQAVYTVRTRAEEFRIDPKKIAVCGFSAGGHLAGHISTAWNSTIISEKLGIENTLARPDASILCYPVISGIDHPNVESFRMLFGSDAPSREELESASLEKLVDDRTCPAFVWHTSSDDCVPVENSLLYCAALAAHNIPFELHVFPVGPHGLSLADRQTCPSCYSSYVAKWVQLCLKWCENVFYGGNFR